VFRFKFQINNGDDLQWVYVMARILGSLFVSSCVLLGEKAIIQLISITYHQRSFANRIKDSKREVFLLGLMYDASRTLFPMWCPEFSEEDYIINDSIEMMISGGKKRRVRGHKKSGSVTPMHFIGGAAGGIGRVGDKITSVFGNLASEITGKQVFNPNSAHSIVVEALEKVPTSEALARRIWMSFVVEGNDSLYAEDIVEVLGPGHKEDAEECFEAVDADMNGDISLDEMVRKVVEIGKERKAISNSMKDIGQALRVLDSVLLFVVILIVVFIFLSFFNSVCTILLLLRIPVFHVLELSKTHHFRIRSRWLTTTLVLRDHTCQCRHSPPVAFVCLLRHMPGIPRFLHLPLHQTSL
jgi:hypothetical protein